MSYQDYEFDLTAKLNQLKKHESPEGDVVHQKLFFPITVGKLILNVDIKNQISILTSGNVQNDEDRLYAQVFMLYIRNSVPQVLHKTIHSRYLENVCTDETEAK